MDTKATLPSRNRITGLLSEKNGLRLAGLLLLALGACWWSLSLQKNRLAGGQRTWVPPANVLGVDFLNNYYAARHWLQGGNPYTEDIGDPLHRPFVYSPILLTVFSWCRFFSEHTAIVIWMAAVAVMAAAGAVACWRARQRLGLWDLPLPFVLAAVLCSFPVSFALERGNCDVLVLMLILVVVAALRRHTFARDLVIGLCVALAIWIKVYPAMLVVGLLAARRPRAVVCVLAAYAALGLWDYQGTLQHIESTRAYVGAYDVPWHASVHTLTTYWKHLWEGTRFARLTRIPGVVGAACVLLPGVLWVSYQVFRRQSRGSLLFPYFAWLTAVGTFLPPVSNDYNLFFLPLATLAVWDRRDRLAIHLMMAPLLLWWQPVQLSVGPVLMLGFKLVGLAAVGFSLVARCREQPVAVVQEEVWVVRLPSAPEAA